MMPPKHHYQCSQEEYSSTGIYTITSKINGKIYVGSAGSQLGFLGRWRMHVFELNRGTHHNKHLQNHVNKYGIDDLVFDVLEICDNKFITGAETYWINVLNTVNEGFNMEYYSPLVIGKTSRVLKKLDEELVVDLYYNQKFSATDVAIKLKVSISPIKRILQTKGITIRRSHSKINDFNQLYTEYLCTPLTAKEFAKQNRTTVTRMLQKFKGLGLLSRKPRRYKMKGFLQE